MSSKNTPSPNCSFSKHLWLWKCSWYIISFGFSLQELNTILSRSLLPKSFSTCHCFYLFLVIINGVSMCWSNANYITLEHIWAPFFFFVFFFFVWNMFRLGLLITTTKKNPMEWVSCKDFLSFLLPLQLCALSHTSF